MKRYTLLAVLCTLTLLLTACGRTEGKKDQPTQTAETTALSAPSTEEMPIQAILLSSANGFSGRGSFIYITPTQIMTGRTAYADMIKGDPLKHAEDIEQLQITEITEEAFEELCAQLRELRYDQLPRKIERPDHMSVKDASDFYLSIWDSRATAFVSEGYAAAHYHEGFYSIWSYLSSQADALLLNNGG